MEKILSIIIPVYNVEKYLERCVNSILSQDLNNCEIILVDDGSTDNSGKICDNYKKTNKIISVFHKENGGLSDARNFGIKKASGEYIWFIDSDDYIEDDAINKLIKILKKEKPDTLVCTSKVVDENNKIYDECEYTIKTGNYNCNDYMKELKLNPNAVIFCAQYHICKRKLIIENNTLFYKGIIHEDELWTPQILLLSKKIYYSNLNIYYHYMRSDSIMHASKLEKSGECNLIVANALFNIFDKYNNINLDYVYDRAVNIYLQSVWKVQNFNFKKNNYRRKYLLKKSTYFKTKIKAMIYMFSPKLYLYIHKKTKERRKTNAS